ncbi:hypothetical protein ONS96_006806 [Cadophora gregata f. sp. sojae]|nr:hypothetical protein ONS96_006806 [Cadophora gregata f. sp. sojae]
MKLTQPLLLLALVSHSAAQQRTRSRLRPSTTAEDLSPALSTLPPEALPKISNPPSLPANSFLPRAQEANPGGLMVERDNKDDPSPVVSLEKRATGAPQEPQTVTVPYINARADKDDPSPIVVRQATAAAVVEARADKDDPSPVVSLGKRATPVVDARADKDNPSPIVVRRPTAAAVFDA